MILFGQDAQLSEQVLAFGLSVEEKVTREGGGREKGEREDKNQTRKKKKKKRVVMDLNLFCSTVTLSFEPKVGNTNHIH